MARASGLRVSELREALRWANVPGAAWASLAMNGISGGVLGSRNLTNEQPVNMDTIFEAASLTKPVFAYAVMELVRQGGLDLFRPLDAYLPKPYPIADKLGGLITGHHVLTHTSGLPNWRHSDGEPLRLSFAPGTRYQYSGEGFYFLQTVVERVTGESVEVFMRPVLDALGMQRSSFVWREEYGSNAAAPYDSALKPLPHDSQTQGEQLSAIAASQRTGLGRMQSAQVLAALRHLTPPLPELPINAMPNVAWSLFTTATEYARFVQRLIDEPHHPMLQPIVRLNRFIWRGLGIALQRDGAVRGFFHTGSNPGFKSAMIGDLGSKRAAVSFTNGDGGFAFNMRVLELAVGEQPALVYLEEP